MLFCSVEFYEILIILIIVWLTIVLRSSLGCIFLLFRILFQSIFIQLIIKLNRYIYKFTKSINLILYFHIIFIIYNLILNFFLKSSSVYILKNLVVLSNIINIINKFRNIFGNRFDLINY